MEHCKIISWDLADRCVCRMRNSSLWNYNHKAGSHWSVTSAPTKLKARDLDSPGTTTTSTVFSPSFSCHAVILYDPGGNPSILKLPSTSLTAKKGCLKTLT